MALTPEDKKVIVAAVVVVLGGNAGALFNAGTERVRHDPFTGTQAKELVEHLQGEMERERRILKGEILSEVRSLQYKNERDCEADKQAIRDRISVVEQNQEHCLRMIRQHDGVLKGRQ